jgi:hypothetical protein
LLYWARIGPFPDPLPIDRFNSGFANPAFDKIKAYVNRFGNSNYQRDLGHILKANYQPNVNMVDHLADTRNKIAHGDINTTKTPLDLREMVVIIRKYCVVTDKVLATWCKNNLCTIR